MSSLIMVVLTGDLERVKTLCTKGADATFRLPNGMQALHYAYLRGHRAIFEYLLSLDARWEGQETYACMRLVSDECCKANNTF